MAVKISKRKPLEKPFRLTEKQIQKQITDYIDKYLNNKVNNSIYWYHTKFSMKSKPGFPDLLIIVKKVINKHIKHEVWFVEVKSENGKLTKKQKEFFDWYYDGHRTANKSDENAIVVRSLDEFIEKFQFLGLG
jgi:hypothetical protein